MKKTITILALTISIVSQAATFRWNTQSITFDSVNVGAGQPVSLLYLGNGGSFDYASFFDNDYTVQATHTTMDGKSSGQIGLQPTTVSGSPTSNGDVYLAVIKRTVGGLDYYNASTLPFVISGVVDDSSDIPNYVAQFNFGKTDLSATYGVGGDYATLELAQTALWGKAGSGWTSFTFIPVPEPATGAMALAGLALLFRRKRK